MKEKITCEECGFTYNYDLMQENKGHDVYLEVGEQYIVFYLSCPYNDEDTEKNPWHKECGNAIEVKKHFVFTDKTEVLHDGN